MKKLALMVVLAVVASKLLHTARDRPNYRPEMTTAAVLKPWGPDAVADPPRPPGPPAKSARRKGERPAPKRTVVLASTSPAVVPPWFPKTEAEEEAAARPDEHGIRILIGRLSASEDRAKDDLRKLVEKEVHDWIAADVPTSWTPPNSVYGELIRYTYVQPVTRSFKPAPGEVLPDASKSEAPELDEIYTLYRACQKLDFSPARRAEVVERYRREVAKKRMWEFGGGIGFALASLLVLSSYIKTDEATKGYYTKRLRLLALVGLGGAGAVAYRLLV